MKIGDRVRIVEDANIPPSVSGKEGVITSFVDGWTSIIRVQIDGKDFSNLINTSFIKEIIENQTSSKDTQQEYRLIDYLVDNINKKI